MLAVLLQDEIAAITELRDLLFQEYTALKTRNLAQLKRITPEKQLCTSRLQALIEQHTHVLQQRDGRDASMRAYIASASPSEQVQLETLWVELRKAFTEMRQQNGINGAIIAASRSHIERALAILWGHHSQESLYDQGAHMTFASTYHSLAKA